MKKSKGHITFLNGYEYFKAPNGSLYKAKSSNYIGIEGYRVGARFEATSNNVDDRIKYLLTI